jgi:hypothetical protein
MISCPTKPPCPSFRASEIIPALVSALEPTCCCGTHFVTVKRTFQMVAMCSTDSHPLGRQAFCPGPAPRSSMPGALGTLAVRASGCRLIQGAAAARPYSTIGHARKCSAITNTPRTPTLNRGSWFGCLPRPSHAFNHGHGTFCPSRRFKPDHRHGVTAGNPQSARAADSQVLRDL